ncbi:MAG: type II and III secretion system protein, partial [Planctomycetes bacterium]|nr:type II and III secretion system protein [Planctomycetota bacterium]
IARTEGLYDVGLGNEDGLVGSGGFSLQYTFLDDTQLNLVLRAVEKSERREVLTEPSLMVYNNARSTLTVANQVSYVGDFDVEIAQAAAIADPIVRVARDGVFLDVRPVVSADRRFTFIDVRPTVASLVRPLPTFQTSLGTGSPVTMQLPELELQKIRTRVMIPDGGTLLLGGMKMINQQDFESGVPIVSQIPLLSFFFSRKGEYESYQKLLILLSAQIVIPEEHEPSTTPGSAL